MGKLKRKINPDEPSGQKVFRFLEISTSANNAEQYRLSVMLDGVSGVYVISVIFWLWLHGNIFWSGRYKDYHMKFEIYLFT